MSKNQVRKQLLAMGELASGAKLTVPVYTIEGENPGKTVYIQANMHGAEVQGNAVIFQLLEKLQQLTINGTIVLVPYANPVACNHKNGEYTLGRFDPITGVNWNRMYFDNKVNLPEFVDQYFQQDEQTIEQAYRDILLAQLNAKLDHNQYGLTTGQRIAYQLQKMAHQADIVLDLHTGPISSKHLYCPEYAKASASYFNIEHTILIPNDFAGAMDEATFCPWWSLADAFEQAGRPLNFIKDKQSFTVELGSQEQINLAVAEQDAQSILCYLQAQQVLAEQQFIPANITRYACYLKDYKAFYSPMGGMIDYLAELGEPLAANQPLARILRMDNYGDGAPLHNVSVNEPVLPILHFASASVNQGTELYKVFTNFFTL